MKNLLIKSGTNAGKFLAELLRDITTTATSSCKDHDGKGSSKRIVGYCSFIVLVVMWIGAQFYNNAAPETLVYVFTALIIAAFGFSRKKGNCTKKD